MSVVFCHWNLQIDIIKMNWNESDFSLQQQSVMRLLAYLDLCSKLLPSCGHTWLLSLEADLPPLNSNSPDICSMSHLHGCVCFPLIMAWACQAERPTAFPGCLRMCTVEKSLLLHKVQITELRAVKAAWSTISFLYFSNKFFDKDELMDLNQEVLGKVGITENR